MTTRHATPLELMDASAAMPVAKDCDNHGSGLMSSYFTRTPPGCFPTVFFSP
jgi:hypothetical protein